jgi:cellulose synthase/poly-beta-1,6-N-acetylglucosamine synthase-like glycosyltransferase
MEAVFWIAAAAVVYVYAGYPLLLTALSFLFRRPPRKAPVEPFVSILVAAYNEADVIGDKVRNALDLDYPADKLEIAIASDGSGDATSQIVRSLAHPQVRLFDYPVNRGKITALNETVPHLKGEILALTDASSMLDRSALRLLVESFADQAVGAVSGVYKVRNKDAAQLGAQEDFYWKYETFLKVQEAALGSILGAHGSLYAIRRKLYPFPGKDTINDDYVIPLRVLQKGYRVAYEPRSVAYEEAHEMDGFGRRVRIMAGNIQQMKEIGPLLKPLQPMALFFFLSHKTGRVIVPVCLLLMLAANAVLAAGSPFYLAIGVLQFLFYAFALAGAIWKLRPKILRLPYYFCLINLAALIAIWQVLVRRRGVQWKKS